MSIFFFENLQKINKQYPCFIYAWLGPGQYRIFLRKIYFPQIVHVMDKTPYMAERRFQAFLEMLILVMKITVTVSRELQLPSVENYSYRQYIETRRIMQQYTHILRTIV